jgi:ferrous-iron efflux pump FieF
MSGAHGHSHAHTHNHAHGHSHGTLTSRAALASMVMALTLLGMKIYAVLQTGSVAMLGSLADTGLDVLASLVTLFGVRFAAQPADDNHTFGHGKAEALVAMFQVFVITLSGLGIGWEAIHRLASHAHLTENPEFGIGVSLVAIVLTGALVLYQNYVVKRTGSVAIHADHVHYQADLLINVAVIVALVLDHYLGLHGADAGFGVLIAAWLLYGAYGASQAAVHQLMDHEWPEEERAAFIRVAEQHPELKGIHDLRTRTSGSRSFVQFHVWVDGAMTVAEAHRVMDEVEAQLMIEFPNTEVLIHPDPEGHRD